MFSRPVASPFWFKRPAIRLEYRGQNEFSLLRRMSRSSRIPQVCGSFEAKRRLRKGIANLTTKPSDVSLASESKIVSKEKSKSWPSVHKASAWTPKGLEKNAYARR